MLYNQPYGISDLNAPYINGNPATGTMGSIPPAASIEFPQREIVNLITKSNLVPTNSDLDQLAKAVQSGLVNYGNDVGEVNDIQITPVVPLAQYYFGQHFIIKVRFGNTSQVTVNINGLGKVPLIHVNLTPLNAYELLAGQLIEIAYDGAQFQVIAGATGGAVQMTAPQILYLDANIGSDTLYDGTSPIIGGVMAGPFKTFRKAMETCRKYNLGGWNFTIKFADGVYADPESYEVPMPNGSGTVILQGNASNPGAVSIFNTGQGTPWRIRSGGVWAIQGFAFRATAPAPGDGGHGLWLAGATSATLYENHWATVTGDHILCGPASNALITHAQTITGSCGEAFQHAFANGTLYSHNVSPDVQSAVITAPVNIPVFMLASHGGQCRSRFDGGFTGAANVTGSKYQAIGNGVIDTGGAGINYLPGSTPGVLATGGQYL
jgi:hypothetical protein